MRVFSRDLRKVTVAIPARMASTRLPGKPLAFVGDKPLIAHVIIQALKAKIPDEVVVATDSSEIYQVALKYGARPIMTSSSHQSGSDRIWEAVGDQKGVIINVQGDEPFIEPELIDALASEVLGGHSVVTACAPLIGDQNDPSIVKILVKNGFADKFSRDPLGPRQYQHMGIYAYHFEALKLFTSWPRSRSEQQFSLEQLRFMDNGISIRVIEWPKAGVSVDTPQDLEIANEIYQLLQF